MEPWEKAVERSSPMFTLSLRTAWSKGPEMYLPLRGRMP